jgi:hypothetical protein
VVLAAAETPAWLLLAVPAVTAFLGFVAGQLVPEFLSRRALARSRYDTAIAAVSKAASTRHGVGVRVPPEYLRSTTGAEHASVEAELSKAGVERFVREDAEARAALAVLYPWSPDLRAYWDRPFMDENAFDEVVGILVKRRKRPFKRHGQGS